VLGHDDGVDYQRPEVGFLVVTNDVVNELGVGEHPSFSGSDVVVVG